MLYSEKWEKLGAQGVEAIEQGGKVDKSSQSPRTNAQ